MKPEKDMLSRALLEQDSQLCNLRPPKRDAQINQIADDLSGMKEEMRQNHAEEEAEKMADKRFKFFDTIITAFIGAVVGLAVEHWRDIYSFLVDVWEIIFLEISVWF